MLIGYVRVSKSDGTQTVAPQRDAMLAAGVDITRIHEDLASGRHDARSGLAACTKAIQPGNTLVLWKLDRLGRDLRHLVNTVEDLRTPGVGLKVLTGAGAQIDTTTANGRLAFGIFAAFAEFERELIAERTMAGLAAARARGRMGGRPRKMNTPAPTHVAPINSRRAWAFVLPVVLGVLACPAYAAAATHDVSDMSGATVTVPVTVARIAEQFPAHTVTDIMLGAGNRLVAIPYNVKTIPFLQKVFPPIAAVPELFKGGTVNIEDLLARRPDLVSALGAGVALKPFQAAGLPAVVMSFETMDQLPRSILLAGDVYGGAAPARARAFVDYFEQAVARIRSRVATLRSDQRPKVVHISGYPPLVVDGGPTLIRDWIKLAGGEDGAQGIATVHVGIGIEQLLAWDPDILIVQTPGGDQGVAAATGRSIMAALATLNRAGFTGGSNS